MRVLVTGGAGFIGSHVEEHFSKKGEVTVLDNLSRSDVLSKSVGSQLYNWDYLKGLGGVTLLRGDVRRFEDVRAAMDGVVAIVHTAGQVAVTSSLVASRLDFEVNALGTLNVLEAARLFDASLVFLSTNKVYGENVNRLPWPWRVKDMFSKTATMWTASPKTSPWTTLATHPTVARSLPPTSTCRTTRTPMA
jgi:CDP-paratose 2-epimerase